MYKRILSIIMALIMVLLAFSSCSNDGDTETTDDETTVELTYNEDNAILLSGENRYRIVYSSTVASLTVQNILNRLNVLDEAEGVTYESCLDTKTADDGAPEILVGLTNRALSTEAKGMLSSALDYAIVISGNKIAIYAHTPAGLTQAVTYFRSKLVVNEIGQVFYSEKENYVKKVTQFAASNLTIDGVSINNFTVIVPKNADADTLTSADKIATLFMEKTGAFITVKDDSAAVTANEILVGNTNRNESKALLKNPVDVGGDYRISVANKKLAIAASGTVGYENAVAYITKLLALNEKKMTADHSINSLSLSQIESVTFGAVYLNKTKDGVYFHKCTADQMKAWAAGYSDANIGKGATYSTGIRLDFYTNSSFLAFRIAPDSGTKFELHINGEYVKTITADKNTTVVEELDNSKGENRVMLLFPSYSTGALSSVQLSEGATITPYTYSTKILFMGDSITHGHGISRDSGSYAQLTSKYFNADSIIQGVGGGDFNANTLDPNLRIDPDYIIVSFGCNDWNRNKNNESGFRTKLNTYMDKLKAIYPNAKVIFITPIPRRDYDNVSQTYDMSLAETRSIIASECANRGWYSVNGADLVPDNAQYYGDPLHPNLAGHELYAKNLCEALKQYIK